MKRFIPLFVCMCMGCAQKMEPIPSEVLPPDKMKFILADFHIADALAETRAEAGQNEKMLFEKYQNQVLTKHHVTKKQFYESYKFYESHPEHMNLLYDDVLNIMSKEEEKLSR